MLKRQDVNTKGLAFVPMPDSRRILYDIDESPRGFRLVWPNYMTLPVELYRSVLRDNDEFRFPRKSYRLARRPDWIINFAADYDEYKEALNWLEQTAKGQHFPVFNAPGDVMKTRRDTIYSELAGVAAWTYLNASGSGRSFLLTFDKCLSVKILVIRY